ncbi:glycosyltransferase [Sphingobacterium sp. SRCM116780]|uniref:glycosyltransferase family 2 protein n=1 Tax=Sphingobacterium sp. SRCM116780 TaxID=2907623 RepID=UPI001F187459|nr:glycosyltransferase family 2 protein [Sphingobacterium sp. SRCM116780]UIR56012.1 glycosyltransferase [Sphingobacterium sp. SRCM116780]
MSLSSLNVTSSTTFKYEISVIIPIYNAAHHILKSGRSLFEQSFPSIQYIFVNDCSKDDSIQILQNLIEQYPNRKSAVTIIDHAINKGVAASRNTGLKAAQGKYIGWCDADDCIALDMFEKLHTYAVATSAEITWCDFYNSFPGHTDYILQTNDVASFACIQALIQGKMMGALWNKLVLKALFDTNKIEFPEGLNMSEDLRVMVQLFYYSKKNSYLNNAFYYYQKDAPSSVSTLSFNSPIINNDRIENIKAIERFIIDKNIPNMGDSLKKLKFSAKLNLLIKGREVQTFKEWRILFSETNSFLWKSHLPLSYKILAYCANHQFWSIIKIWIFIKYKLIRK